MDDESNYISVVLTIGLTCLFKSIMVRECNSLPETTTVLPSIFTKKHIIISPTHHYKAHDKNRKVRLHVIAMFGGQCAECMEADWRVLQINHIAGDGKEDRTKYGSKLYEAILKGRRDKKGLELLCANCNTLHEFKLGRRRQGWWNHRAHSKVIKMLGGKCARCGNTDLRVLNINHKYGRSKDEQIDGCFRTIHFCDDIIGGKRGTADLDVLCANCNVIYEYEVGRLLQK